MSVKISVISPRSFIKAKKEHRKLSMITAYDYPTACLLDRAGVDMILVGDSLGNVIQGKKTTLPVTLDEMIYHSELVARAAENAMVIVDMPFPFCQLGAEDALKAAVRILKESGADAVKIEGGQKRAETVARLVDAGIPVCGHCGLLPQSVHQEGYRIQRAEEQLLEDVQAIEKAGAFAIVLECVTAEIAKKASELLTVPTIGIGSGSNCDGQVLVFHDMFLFSGKKEEELPKHVRLFGNIQQIVLDGVAAYRQAIQDGTFPGEKESFHS